ncbi:sensor histidine kinase [Lacinutrix mariniflava]|uniref:sensor histidine kinase n=1 Tax=Lacinutrix mariniflava TaxID=342955 RepID=UPI0006E44C18|nr:ATP-binding protein [Lacinutrix mariniflava]
MNSLLKRQLRKFLSEELKENKELAVFLNAVDSSYNNFEEQSTMIQRAMAISSDELYAANRKLQNEAEEQKKVIDKLKSVINTLKFYNLKEDEKLEDVELTGSGLVDFIDSQTKEIVEVNKQKQSMLNELAHQNQELSDYAHMVSHDLKSPLRSIDALTTWLSEDYKDAFDDDGKNTLSLIRDNVEKMDTLINGILEYSTIGKDQVEIYNVDVNGLIENILNSMHIPKNISITKINLPIIKGDKYRLQQLFQNLISNAIKYNNKEKGTIEIVAQDQQEYWQFYIRDNGKGIEETYFNKIFKTFIKLENSPESTGIGLSIVKKIVELYEGKIWLESQVNIGTTFYFTLKKNRDGTT